MKKVFIDGSAGTTGLRIYERLEGRKDIELIKLAESVRKDPAARKEALNSADIAFLCLPDDAAREAVAMVENPDTVILDTSTAHRTAEGWCYGFPELSKERWAAVKSSKRIAVPGCHAGGFIALVYPLVAEGFIDKSALLCCHSITGYSGGGKKMIAEYEGEELDPLLAAPRQYALTASHKHLKEMSYVTGIENYPSFCPIVSGFYSGMAVTVPVFSSMLKKGATAETVRETYKRLYTGPVVSYKDNADENGFFSAARLEGKDSMELSVMGCDERILLMARYDNLGKGASGAALECMNIVMGLSADYGLNI